MEKVRILVLDRGFVVVAYCPDPTGYALWLPLKNVRVIRRWGTTKGIAELKNGPLTDTVLDAVSAVETVPIRAILRIIDVEESAWKRHLQP